jgi:hypothetical protein
METKMNDYEVGYKKPPRHSQFKVGNRANPKGRGARKRLTEADIMKKVLNFAEEYRHGGKAKRAPRIELIIKQFGARALKGDVGAAFMLLVMHRDFQKNGDVNPRRIVLIPRVIHGGYRFGRPTRYKTSFDPPPD